MGNLGVSKHLLMTRRGFTLIELLLTVLILAIIMALIYGVVASTIQAQQRIEETMLGSEVGPALLAQIRDDLEGAFVPDPKEEGFLGIDRKANAGDRDRIDLVTTTMSFASEKDEDPRFHGVNEVGYQLRDNPDNPSLGILYRRLDPFVDADPLKGGRLTELYDRVKHFNVTYFDGKNWVNDWSSKKQEGKLPLAIKVELIVVVSAGNERTVEKTYAVIVTRPE